MQELPALRSLARALGVQPEYTNGLGMATIVEPETLVHICAALGASIASVEDAPDALHREEAQRSSGLPPVIVAWEGILPPVTAPAPGVAWLELEEGRTLPLPVHHPAIGAPPPLPSGYHSLTVEHDGRRQTAAVISAPIRAWRQPAVGRSWGVGAQLAALRSRRSRSVGDLADLRTTCNWVKTTGGDLVTLLPLLPTFNSPWPEPSPYSAVSRLFWSELILDLGADHRPCVPPISLDPTRAESEVIAALADRDAPDRTTVDPELLRYCAFRGAQGRLGRNWREWPTEARSGVLTAEQIDPEIERFHLLAQLEARHQLAGMREELDRTGVRLGLDLAVGVHPDGYDPWSRQELFSDQISVGAPPDAGFPSGQDWGFSPILPGASRAEGHRYIARSIAHQASLAGVLRVDHIMAWHRLYWIPRGMGLHQGTYVHYPEEELFAILTLESHRHRCEIIGENLGTVPAAIDEALPRHGIRGLYVAMFQDRRKQVVRPPDETEVAMIGTHDTATFAGWLACNDISDRVRHGLLAPEQEAVERAERDATTSWLAERLGLDRRSPHVFLQGLLDWLGRSGSSLVIPWIEDLWLEPDAVNLPGTPSSRRPNWQRPMRRLLDEIIVDPEIALVLRTLRNARAALPAPNRAR